MKQKNFFFLQAEGKGEEVENIEVTVECFQIAEHNCVEQGNVLFRNKKVEEGADTLGGFGISGSQKGFFGATGGNQVVAEFQREERRIVIQ